MADDAANYEQEMMEHMDCPSNEDIDVYNIEKEENRFYYPSNSLDIYNAMSGYSLRTKRGSYDELRYFRTIDTSGLADKGGILSTSKSEPSRSGNYLYYSSPEAYERHWDTTLPEDTKKVWHSRNKLMFPGDGEFNKESFETIKEDIYKMKGKEIETSLKEYESNKFLLLEQKKEKDNKTLEKKEMYMWAFNENRKRENERIKTENEWIKKENKRIKKENKQIKKENKQIKKDKIILQREKNRKSMVDNVHGKN